MIERLLEDWAAGDNRFDQPGECLFGFYEGELLAVAGVNRHQQPELGEVGRIRRVFVHPDVRDQGVGTRLVKRVMQQAGNQFSVFTVNVGKRSAYGFYQNLGFMPAKNMQGVTHFLTLEAEQSYQETALAFEF